MEVPGARQARAATLGPDLPVHVTVGGRAPATRDGVRAAPSLPGCYIFRDPDGQVLYVGKSVTLRTPLASYFATDRERKVIAMTRRAATVDWHLTSSEVEALVLESALVKRFQPPYNVQLRTYPHYTFLRLADPGSDGVPFLETTQGVGADGQPHFGPCESAVRAAGVRGAAAHCARRANVPSWPNPPLSSPLPDRRRRA